MHAFSLSGTETYPLECIASAYIPIRHDSKNTDIQIKYIMIWKCFVKSVCKITIRNSLILYLSLPKMCMYSLEFCWIHNISLKAIYNSDKLKFIRFLGGYKKINHRFYRFLRPIYFFSDVNTSFYFQRFYLKTYFLISIL